MGSVGEGVIHKGHLIKEYFLEKQGEKIIRINVSIHNEMLSNKN